MIACYIEWKKVLGKNSLAGRAPQAQVDPAGLEFSVAARSQVHLPAGRAPVTLSVSILK